jgi:hypothetical protein
MMGVFVVTEKPISPVGFRLFLKTMPPRTDLEAFFSTPAGSATKPHKQFSFS